MRDWLISTRKEAQKSQEDVAREAGISQPSYHAIEAGKANPRPETAKKIAAVLGFPWPRFYEDEEEAAAR